MTRPQFTLRALLMAMLTVAAFLGGMAIGIRQGRQGRIDELVAEQERLVAEQNALKNEWLARVKKASKHRQSDDRRNYMDQALMHMQSD